MSVGNLGTSTLSKFRIDYFIMIFHYEILVKQVKQNIVDHRCFVLSDQNHRAERLVIFSENCAICYRLTVDSLVLTNILKKKVIKLLQLNGNWTVILLYYLSTELLGLLPVRTNPYIDIYL